MRFSKRFTIIGIFMALIFAMFAIVPVTAQTAGTLEVETAFGSSDNVAPNGTEVTITVTDDDLNVAVEVEDELTYEGDRDDTVDIGSLDAGDSITAFVANPPLRSTPVLVDDPDTADDESSPLILEVVISSAVQGRFVITAGGGGYDASDRDEVTTLIVDYTYDDVTYATDDGEADGDTLVTVESSLGGTIHVLLEETGDATGVFTGTFSVESASDDEGTGDLGEEDSATTASTACRLEDDADCAITGRALNQNGTIEIFYADDDPTASTMATMIVENTAPTVTVVSPADDSRTTDTTPTLVVQITDLSGIDEDSITFDIDSGDDSAAEEGDGNAPDEDDVTAIADGVEVEFPITDITDDDVVLVSWDVNATDEAGNVVELEDVRFTVDNVDPIMQTATTGTWWDTDDGLMGDDSADPDAADMANMIGIEFDEDLDADTVSATDFEVDGDEPEDATVYDDAENWVFLTLAADLDADAEPDVEIVGSISDVAGNSLTDVELESLDGIRPAITHTLSSDDTDNVVTGGDVDLDFSFDEAVGTPIVTITNDVDDETITVADLADEDTVDITLGNAPLVSTPTLADDPDSDDDESDTDVLAVAILDADAGTIRITAGEAYDGTGLADNVTITYDYSIDQDVSLVSLDDNSYSVEIDADDLDDGRYDVFIRAFDVADLDNTSEVGDQGFDDSDIFLEVDSDVPDPAGGDDLGDLEEAAVQFISVDFGAAEGDEYGGDSHSTVAISAADLDGDDVLDLVDNFDDENEIYEFAFAGLAVADDYTLTLTATDEAGNEEDIEIGFSVVARGEWELELDAGWNLVSFPGDPADTNIDSVFPSTHPATEVLTYDLSDADGPWLVAVRADDGTWTGTLTTIDSSHGYWVNTNSSRDVDVLLALPRSGAALLPTIAVSAGWNLLPVLDLTQADFDTLVDADVYFATINWVLAYNFDAGAWVRATEGEADDLGVGRAYWVWVTGSGTLVP